MLLDLVQRPRHRAARTANHAALLHGEGMVLVESERPDDLHGSHTGQGWVYLAVGDPDAHYRRANAAGVAVLSEPHDALNGAQRGYSARDLEGNLWSFGTDRPWWSRPPRRRGAARSPPSR